MCAFLKIKQIEETIVSRRYDIRKQFIQDSANIKDENSLRVISTEDMCLLLSLYDRIFFDHWFKECFKGKIKFSLSKRMTRSAGLTLCPKKRQPFTQEEFIIEIRIGVNFFFNYDALKGDKMVSGIKTHSGLEALQLVFEHELCHVLEFALYHKSSCKGKRFKEMAFNLFGHTESYHKLPTQKQIVYENLGLKIGDVVCFDFEDHKLKGVLYKINKRATVMVKDKKGLYSDKQRNRYSKYYVPLNALAKEEMGKQ